MQLAVFLKLHILSTRMSLLIIDKGNDQRSTSEESERSCAFASPGRAESCVRWVHQTFLEALPHLGPHSILLGQIRR